ncbi:MAG: electron transport complex subunit RsxC [FCB group bacterium]|nr:electron transport complex subunit RsxC [FCB group bacterium]MBL7028337.1 electron transport complex subunit RsxC [Candidatus Neomarinimicrobiota bacterium]MBL7121656.1 electron transport complex subunit RsxC [Candidatus Neomarinimicrobiota bacterium]
MSESSQLHISTFRRGVHPDEYKDLTCHLPSQIMPLPDEVFIPLQQHIGAPCEALVEKGDTVKTGQKIADSSAFVSSPIHASITGTVAAVASFPHPLGAKVPMIHIKRDGEEDDWELLSTPENWEIAPKEELSKLVREAGIVGLGGAAFPTHVKMSPPADKPIDHFILNGCECEPFLTCDHRNMLEDTDRILKGMAIMMRMLGINQGIVGIESNKADAIATMEARVKALNLNFKIQPLKVKYPQGAEKMLIDAALGRKVPAGGLPMDVGVVVNNIATALAVYEAVFDGKPLIQRMLTVTGDAIQAPGNLTSRIGTPFQVCVDACSGLKDETSQVFMGGPMMGLVQYDLQVPTLKATSGIVCMQSSQLKNTRHYPCIQCGTCVSVCPMNLVPTRLSRQVETGKYQDCKEWGVFNCIECGSCAFVCPSGIPLVQWIRVGKVKSTEQQQKAQA